MENIKLDLGTIALLKIVIKDDYVKKYSSRKNDRWKIKNEKKLDVEKIHCRKLSWKMITGLTVNHRSISIPLIAAFE